MQLSRLNALAALLSLLVGGVTTPVHAQTSGRASPSSGGVQPNVGIAFGFTGSSDVAPSGGWLLESENTARSRRRDGDYEVYRSDNKIGYGLTDTISLGLKVNLGRYDVAGVRGLEDRRTTTFEGLAGLVKYRALERGKDPFGLSIEVGPDWGRFNSGTGAAEESFSIDARLSTDLRIGSSDIYVGSNIAASNAWAWPREDAEQRSSFLEVSTATALIKPDWSIGAEARLLTAYSDLLFDSYAGNALYVGPTASVSFGEGAYAAAGLGIQIAGDDRIAGTSLNLAGFEQHQVRLKVGYTF